MPVPRQISQARAIRWLSVGRISAAVTGSASASRACRAAGPICLSSARASARACGPGSGIAAMPSVSEAKYSPLPPVRIGSRPASRARDIATRAASRHQATLPGSAAGRMP